MVGSSIRDVDRIKANMGASEKERKVNRFFRMNVGKVYLSHDVIMKWLQLERGNIRDVKFNYEMDTLELIIEHPEMPVSEPGYPLATVMLSFVKCQDDMGHSVLIREPIKHPE